MEAIYKKNVAILKKNHPQAYEAILEIKETNLPGEIFLSSHGFPNLKIHREGEDYLIHSHTDMIGDPAILATLSSEKYFVVVVLGMGLGYTIEAIFAHRDRVQKIIVFESEPWILKLAMESRDMTQILSDPRLLLGIGRNPNISDIMKQAHRVLQLEDIQLMKHQILNTLWPEVYEKLYTDVFAEMSYYNIEGGTLSKHGYDLMANRLSMLTSVHHNQMLESLEGKFSDVPAFIVAAGPSLDTNIETLKKAKGKGVIICVDTVLPNLLNHGIKPDFVTCVDFLEFTFEKIAAQAENFLDISLICMPTATRKVPRMIPAREVFWCFTASPPDRWLCDALGGSMVTPGAGTVAHLNLIAAKILGCSEIIFVGQDLAYSQNHFYSADVVLSEVDDIRKRIESNADDIVWTEGNAGKKVPTSRQFYSHIRTFGAMIEGFVTQPCINTSPDGAKINGTQVMPLEEAVRQFCKAPLEVSHRLGTILSTASGPDFNRLASVLEALLKTIAKLRKMVEKADKMGQAVLGKIQKKSKQRISAFGQLPMGVQQNITKIDVLQGVIDSEDTFWSLLDEITMVVLKDSERMKLEIDMIQNRPGKYMEWIKKSITRLAYVNENRLKILEFLEGHIQAAVQHHKKEKQLLSDLLSSSPNGHQILIDLVTLYFESGDMVSAEPYIKQLKAVGFESAALWFYQGVIAANRQNLLLAEDCFIKAEAMDAEISKQIYDFKFNQGNNYLLYASWYKKIGRSTFISMLVKGMWYMPNNGGIRLEIEQLLDEDINQFKDEFEKGLDPESENFSWVWGWKNYMDQGIGLEQIAGQKRMSAILFFCGIYKNLENDHGEALSLFESAHAHDPGNPEILIQMTDVLFALNQFDKGVAALNKAVSLDRKYGRYWENMGDNLMASKDLDSAALAYENCYKALPEHMGVAGKLADCLSRIGQEERARQILGKINNNSI